ncbi:hypothetical protein [Streptomyces marincola]|uniref:Uncharacterized protein n=1 Tax=Streptomyces marincola TaxID=2878388 RepID=A0A1W7CVD6_9ACTN|nr:hypothetical protein [Streptomyces marincola]ARQ68735.1 hypothetical protein CAG99_07595 [Streptomyces marincola]
MTQDPTDPETFDEFLDEERERELLAAGLDDEAPEADTAEQRRPLVAPRDVPPDGGLPDGADPADAVEQARSVEPDEDEYR